MKNLHANIEIGFAEIWLCGLKPGGKSVQSGNRPVLILSNDTNNKFSPTVNVAPLTSRMRDTLQPSHVELWQHQQYGLHCPSTVCLEQITTVSVQLLRRKLGVIKDKETLAAIAQAMAVQFPVIAYLEPPAACPRPAICTAQDPSCPVPDRVSPPDPVVTK
ncbi:MAG: type II toxin-antitoxin system PemK/MazF family toxin [Oscillospiraceae bacterium]|nr:type II toxin-antitoxin system PemK/MazF family toxin [Oscillospiraceae bacterium]